MSFCNCKIEDIENVVDFEIERIAGASVAVTDTYIAFKEIDKFKNFASVEAVICKDKDNSFVFFDMYNKINLLKDDKGKRTKVKYIALDRANTLYKNMIVQEDLSKNYKRTVWKKRSNVNGLMEFVIFSDKLYMNFYKTNNFHTCSFCNCTLDEKHYGKHSFVVRSAIHEPLYPLISYWCDRCEAKRIETLKERYGFGIGDDVEIKINSFGNEYEKITVCGFYGNNAVIDQKTYVYSLEYGYRNIQKSLF